MTKVHELKSWCDYFGDVIDYSKRFELRKDDRAFAVGDYLLLKEWDTEIENGTATGMEIACADYDEAYLERKVAADDEEASRALAAQPNTGARK